MEERNEELARLNPQVDERERVQPLSERIEEIFKKYGMTVTAVLLVVGVTIGAVVGSIIKALKATGKALGNGLKEIGMKLGSMEPRLIAGCELSFQNGGAGGWLSRQAHLVAEPCRGGLFVRTIHQKTTSL